VILEFRVETLDGSDPIPGSDAVEACWVPLGQVADQRLVEGLAEFLSENGLIEVFA
jgi:hypothetical protein